MQFKQLRIEKDLSTSKLSEISGVPQRTIQHIEKNGDCLVSTARKLAAALDVTLDELCKESPAE